MMALIKQDKTHSKLAKKMRYLLPFSNFHELRQLVCILHELMGSKVDQIQPICKAHVFLVILFDLFDFKLNKIKIYMNENQSHV